jgi:hypothetical protein
VGFLRFIHTIRKCAAYQARIRRESMAGGVRFKAARRQENLLVCFTFD